MAELARFLGIVIVIYAEKNSKHHLPHVHARYGEYSAVFSIEDGSVISGSLPSKQEKIVSAWCILRHDNLVKCWEAIINGESPNKIEPIK